MLTLLAVRNVVLIKALELEFQEGLTVLTGETGAGKSILLDALGLALGARANFALIGTDDTSAEVTAIFTPRENHPARACLIEAGIPAQDDIILRRRLRDGKSLALINDTPVSLNIMRECGDLLVEIQGQFEGRGLLDVATHRTLLDRFGGHGDLVEKCATNWQAWQHANTAYQDAVNARKEAESNADWLRDAVAQLDLLAPESGEESRLVAERQKLSNSTRIAEALNETQTRINHDGGSGAVDAVAHGLKIIARIQEYAGDGVDELLAALARAEVELGEVERAITAAMDDLNADPSRLGVVDDRLHELRTQARKHQTTPDALPTLHDDLRQQYASLEDQAGDLTRLAAARDETKAQYDASCAALSQAREDAASRLDSAIMGELPALKLEQARFKTTITQLPPEQCGQYGSDGIRFEASTNPDLPPAPIDQIASGGELARFLLALKVVLSDSAPPVSLIFDEVDAGIGGAVAASVGARLAQLGAKTQAIVITHSPQVAARGTQHYRITKATDQSATISTTTILSHDERIDELSRMLAGKSITDEARAAAQRLLEE